MSEVHAVHGTLTNCRIMPAVQSRSILGCSMSRQCQSGHRGAVEARRPGSIGEGARFLNRQLSNRLFGKTAGLSQLFDFLSLLQYKARTRHDRSGTNKPSPRHECRPSTQSSGIDKVGLASTCRAKVWVRSGLRLQVAPEQEQLRERSNRSWV